MDAEVQAEGPVRGDVKGSQRDLGGADGAHGRVEMPGGAACPGHINTVCQVPLREHRRPERVHHQEAHPAVGGKPHRAGEELPIGGAT